MNGFLPGSRSLDSERAFAGARGLGYYEPLCADWPLDEIETGDNPYRPPRRQVADEWQALDPVFDPMPEDWNPATLLRARKRAPKATLEDVAAHWATHLRRLGIYKPDGPRGRRSAARRTPRPRPRSRAPA